ncbi:type II toxin-antitoxin system CcdA family antitoxin [uncultured Sphingomonas sp.]|uniref:type II toxin-antitoxin system CcdA family antitoxin n=1 Tax=uncultured Sphingomonas sp. TaxID=158754 RepID=UPI0035CC3D8B
MKHEVVTRRRATNVTLPEELVVEARVLGINISKATEQALQIAVRAERNRRWQEEHKDRIDAWNAWFEENGLPFADLRVF